MSKDGLKDLFIQGLRAVHAADEQGRVTAGDIAHAATDPRLKKALAHGSQVAQGLGETLAQVFRAAGAEPSHLDNRAITGIAEDAQRVRQAEQDPQARDLGIIAHAQIALHYHIASYGTLRTYARALGHDEAAGMLQGMLDEAKTQDERFTEVAKQILG
jgi:ferritin-like metal-binding protein YciE